MLPYADADMMQLHLDEISRNVAAGAHAVLILDRAGWHTTSKLDMPDNITPIFLPSRAPELNPVENVWQYLRRNWLLYKKQGVAVRQSYLRVARHARREVGRLMHAGQRKQAERWVRKLRTWTGRLTRDIDRKTVGEPDLVGALAFVLDRVKRLLAQRRDGKNKLYALHAPRGRMHRQGQREDALRDPMGSG